MKTKQKIVNEFPVLLNGNTATVIYAKATKIGQFVVHKGICQVDGQWEAAGGAWLITSTPSGRSITQNAFMRKTDAIRVAHAYNRLVGDTDLVSLQYEDLLAKKIRRIMKVANEMALR